MSLRVSWRLLQAETLVTRNAAHSVMPLFMLSVGLSQGDLGIREAICGLAYLIFNFPIGWIADRLSRKLCNLIGDGLYCAGLVMLGFASSFTTVLIAGLLMALGAASTNGADEALIKAHCDELEIDYITAKRRLTIAGSCVALTYSLTGGLLTVLYGMKTTVLLASLPFLIGAVLSCFIKELGTHKEVRTQAISLRAKISAELRGMGAVVRYALVKDRQLSFLIVAASVGTALGWAVMVFIGPMLLVAGANEGSVGIAYALVAIMNIVGNWCSLRFQQRNISVRFLIAASAALLAMATVSLHMTIWTVAIYILIVHSVRGWMIATLFPMVNKAAPNEVQATVSSLQGCVAHLLFSLSTLVIGFAGNHGAHWGVATNAILFAPLVAVAGWGLYHYASKSKG